MVLIDCDCIEAFPYGRSGSWPGISSPPPLSIDRAISFWNAMWPYLAALWLLCISVSCTATTSTTLVVSTASKSSVASILSTSSTSWTIPEHHTTYPGPTVPSALPTYHQALRRKRGACTRSDIVQDCDPAPVPASKSNTTTAQACGGTPSNTGSTRATINEVTYDFCRSKFSGRYGRNLEYGDAGGSKTITASDGNSITLQTVFDWSAVPPQTSIVMDVQGCYMSFVSAVSICGANATEQQLVLGGNFKAKWNGVTALFYVTVKPAGWDEIDPGAASSAPSQPSSPSIHGNVIAGATGATAGMVLLIVAILFVWRRRQRGKPVCGASTPTYMTPPRTPSPYPFSEKHCHASKLSMQTQDTKTSGPYPAVAWLYDAFPKPPLHPLDRYPSSASATLLNSKVSSRGRVRSSLAVSPTNTEFNDPGHIAWQAMSPTGDKERQRSFRHSAPMLSQMMPPPPAYAHQPEPTTSRRRANTATLALSPFDSAGIRKPIDTFKKQHRRAHSGHAYSCSIYSRGTCGESIAPGSRRPTVIDVVDVPPIPAVHLGPPAMQDASIDNNDEDNKDENQHPQLRMLRREQSAPDTSLRMSIFGPGRKKRMSMPMLASQMSSYYAASLPTLDWNSIQKAGTM